VRETAGSKMKSRVPEKGKKKEKKANWGGPHTNGGGKDRSKNEEKHDAIGGRSDTRRDSRTKEKGRNQ